jgi:hypothetical protein
VPTTIHNIIVGKLWCDQHGTMTITNHTTGTTASLTYTPYSYFTSAEARKVGGPVTDASGRVHCSIDGEFPLTNVTFPFPSLFTSSHPSLRYFVVVWHANGCIPPSFVRVCVRVCVGFFTG